MVINKLLIMKNLFALICLLGLALGGVLRAQEQDGVDEIQLTASLDDSDNQVVGFNFSGTPGERFIIRWGWGDERDTVAVENTDEIEVSHVVKNPTSAQLHIRIAAMNPTGHILSLTIDSIYQYLFISFNSPEITIIRVPHNKLEALYFHYPCSSLKILDCSYNSLSSLSLNEKTESLTHLDCSHNRIVNLSYLSDCKALVSLHCENNQIRDLRALAIPTLREVYCQNNQIYVCELDSNPALERVDCSNNDLPFSPAGDGCPNLTYLDISDNDQLESFGIYDNQKLETIDLSRNPGLRFVYIINSNIKSLDFSANPKLESLTLRGNNSVAMLKFDNPVLQALECDYNRLESLLIDNCAPFATLICRHNRLNSVNLPSDLILGSLTCDSNSLPLSNLAILQKHFKGGNRDLSPQLIPILCQVGQTLDLHREMSINSKATQCAIVDAVDNVIMDNPFDATGRFICKKTGQYRIRLSNFLPDYNGDAYYAWVYYDVTVVDSVARPVFSVSSGAVKPHTPVSLSTKTPDARIYYTTDGSVPDSTASFYAEPIYIDEAVTIKAIAIQDTFASRVATASYTIDLTANESDRDAEQVRIYSEDRNIYLSENIGEVEVFTAGGQCVYRGSATAIPVKRSGLYVVAKGGRWKVMVR